jgi:hypothetical protein
LTCRDNDLVVVDDAAFARVRGFDERTPATSFFTPERRTGFFARTTIPSS